MSINSTNNQETLKFGTIWLNSNLLEMKFVSMLLIAVLFIQAFVEAEVLSVGSAVFSQDDAEGNFAALLKNHHPLRINCNHACSRRCSKSSRKKVCHRACKSCCTRCHCVPPGTYGNKGQCPCYANLRTHGNKLKCP